MVYIWLLDDRVLGSMRCGHLAEATREWSKHVRTKIVLDSEQSRFFLGEESDEKARKQDGEYPFACV